MGLKMMERCRLWWSSLSRSSKAGAGVLETKGIELINFQYFNRGCLFADRAEVSTGGRARIGVTMIKMRKALNSSSKV